MTAEPLDQLISSDGKDMFNVALWDPSIAPAYEPGKWYPWRGKKWRLCGFYEGCKIMAGGQYHVAAAQSWRT